MINGGSFMQVIFLEKAYVLNNTFDEVSIFLNKIKQKVMEENLIVSHCYVDERVIYGSLDELVGSVNLETIQNIDIVALTKRDFVLNIYIEGYEYLKRAISEIEKLITSFLYEEKGENWIIFHDFIDGLQWLIQLTEINADIEFLTQQEFIQIQIELKEHLPKLLACLENQDVILLTDIMSYEVVPVLNRLLEQLGFLVKNNENLEK